MRYLALAAALFLAACSGGTDEDVQYKRDLSAASQQARAKLSYFWEHYDAQAADEYDFALKVAFPRKDGQSGTEDAWVEKLARGPGANDLSGELMVDPLYLGDLKRGALMNFEERQVLDWAFLRGEELLGHYTTRVMLLKMPVEQAEGLKSILGENPK
jgi:uncharacterized protein YegJ (DUF2314 family)